MLYTKPITYLVTGYMRTGTSMMMQALEAGGLEAIRSNAREQMNENYGDEHYKPNPNGFYEPDDWGRLDFPRGYEGKLVKVMYDRITRIAVGNYKVVFMMRDPEEIRQSFEAFFGRAPAIKKYNEIMLHVLELLRNRKDMSVDVFRYEDVIENPIWAFTLLKQYGWPIDIDAASAKVERKLYRFKKEELVHGI